MLLQVCYGTDVACTPVFLNMVSEKQRENLAPDAYVYLDKLGMSSYKDQAFLSRVGGMG